MIRILFAALFMVSLIGCSSAPESRYPHHNNKFSEIKRVTKPSFGLRTLEVVVMPNNDPRWRSVYEVDCIITKDTIQTRHHNSRKFEINKMSDTFDLVLAALTGFTDYSAFMLEVPFSVWNNSGQVWVATLDMDSIRKLAGRGAMGDRQGLRLYSKINENNVAALANQPGFMVAVDLKMEPRSPWNETATVYTTNAEFARVLKASTHDFDVGIQ